MADCSEKVIFGGEDTGKHSRRQYLITFAGFNHTLSSETKFKGWPNCKNLKCIYFSLQMDLRNGYKSRDKLYVPVLCTKLDEMVALPEFHCNISPKILHTPENIST